MDIVTTLLVAIGLAMDAFAVAISDIFDILERNSTVVSGP